MKSFRWFWIHSINFYCEVTCQLNVFTTLANGVRTTRDFKPIAYVRLMYEVFARTILFRIEDTWTHRNCRNNTVSERDAVLKNISLRQKFCWINNCSESASWIASVDFPRHLTVLSGLHFGQHVFGAMGFKDGSRALSLVNSIVIQEEMNGKKRPLMHQPAPSPTCTPSSPQSKAGSKSVGASAKAVF